MSLKISLFRPDGVRSGVGYELFNDDGTFSQEIAEPEGLPADREAPGSTFD